MGKIGQVKFTEDIPLKFEVVWSVLNRPSTTFSFFMIYNAKRLVGL